MRRSIVLFLGLLAVLAAVGLAVLSPAGVRPARADALAPSARAGAATASVVTQALRPGLVSPRELLRDKALRFLARGLLFRPRARHTRVRARVVTVPDLHPNGGVCAVTSPGCSLHPCDEFAGAAPSANAAPAILTNSAQIAATSGPSLRNRQGRCTGHPGVPPRVLRVVLTPSA